MDQKLRILILEDRPEDAELMVYELRKAGFELEWERVDKLESFRAKLSPELDVILADVNLPQFDGLTALNLLKESGLDIPFVVVTGTYEEIALECIKQGAADYLLKDRLARLGNAVSGALDQQRFRLEKELAERQLRLSEERYRCMFDGVHDAILVENRAGIIVDANIQACMMYGYDHDNLVGKHATELIAAEGCFDLVTESGQDTPGHPFENLHKRSTGEVFPVELTVQVQAILDEEVFLLVVRDISIRRKMQAALLENEARFRNLAEATPNCIVITDDDLRVIYFNRAAKSMCGAAGTPGGVCVLDYFDRQEQTLIRMALEGIRATGEGVVLGLIDPLIMNVKEKTFPAEVTISSWLVDDRRSFSFIVRDLTEHLEALQQEQVQHRLAAVGQMAAGIAHDFNNALMPIGLYAEMIIKDEEISDRMKDQMKTILKQADRAAKLTAQILDFSRQALLNLKPMNVHAFLESMVNDLFSRTFPSNIRFRLNKPDKHCVVRADLNRMQQVFLNLALNSRDAMPQGGMISFMLSKVSVLPGQEKDFGLPSGDWVHIVVTDDGKGIADETLPYIFEPFFTTKPRGEGSGLGLSQVYGIITQHNGFIRVSSELGQGTTFDIFLPASDQIVFDQEVKPSFSRPSSREVVLVVEDDLINRRTVSDILEYADYRVMTAVDGDEAHAVIREHAQSIDVILCDMFLPGISGVELVSGFKKILPGAGLILMTGHPIAEEERQRIEETGVLWLIKPFTYDDVMATIQTALSVR